MATMDGNGAPRKRVAMYGKAYRKRPQDYITTNSLFDMPSPDDEDTNTPAGPVSNSIVDKAPITTNSRPTTVSRPSAPIDIYDFPSDDDRPTVLLQKKRKLGDVIPSSQLDAATTKQQTAKMSPHKAQKVVPGSSQITKEVVGHDNMGQKPIQQPNRAPPKPKTRLPDKPTSPRQSKQQDMQHRIKSPGKSEGRDSGYKATTKQIKAGTAESSTRSTMGGFLTSPKATLPTSMARPVTPMKTKANDRARFSPAPTTPPPGTAPEMQVGSSSRRSTPGILTPRGLEMWKDLLGNDDVDESVSVEQRHNMNSGVFRGTLKPPRRRLIDSLVEQSNGSKPQMFSSDSEDDTNTEIGVSTSIAATVDDKPWTFEPSDDGPTFSRRVPVRPVGDQSSQLSQTAGPKVTYSRQRSMLAEQILSDKMAFEMPLHDSQPLASSQRRGSIPILAPLPTFHEQDEDDESQVRGGIRTLHELRQAGANSRFESEVDDILDQIGSPGSQISLRRSGLLDLAEKMNEKEFCGKFISLGKDQRLFVHLGKEIDIVSGFLILSILLRVLEDGITAVVVTQLRRQGITRLLIRQLEAGTEIAKIAKDRKTNMSKAAQSMLLSHQTAMLKMKFWAESSSSSITPRTGALCCLEAMVRQIREAGNSTDIISKELTTKLFAIVNIAGDLNGTDVLTSFSDIDFQLALSTLESHSLKGMTNSEEALWVAEFLPIIRGILTATLRFSASECAPQQILALRLTLNVTNNNPSASDVFASSELMMLLEASIVDKFKRLSMFLTEDERVTLVDHLVLMLGVVINFAEWSVQARDQFKMLQDTPEDPLRDLVQIYVNNLERMVEADSMEDVHRNVAFGYLSVLLGYLCLNPTIADTIRSGMHRNSLRPLVDSVEEFISHHKKVDDLWEEDADGHNPNAGLTQRLQEMADKLKAV